MATMGRIIFWSMIVLIVLFAAIIVLCLTLALTGSPLGAESSNKSPVANLREDIVLSCFLPSDSQAGTSVGRVSVTWTKEGLGGLVYRYTDGAADLRDQNEAFKMRTEIFPDAIANGNASLLLRRVRMSDAGVYGCAIGSSGGGGDVSIRLRVAAYSAPAFTRSQRSLVAEAQRWFPKPNVTWSDLNGNVLNGTVTQLSQNSTGTYHLLSTLQGVSTQNSYICTIQNQLVSAVATATITDSGVTDNTFFTFSAASSILPLKNLIITSSVKLGIHYLLP